MCVCVVHVLGGGESGISMHTEHLQSSVQIGRQCPDLLVTLAQVLRVQLSVVTQVVT